MKTDKNNVLYEPLTETAARNVAAMLKRTGYTQATIEHCRRKSPVEIAAYFQPLSDEDRAFLLQAIAQTAGFVPKKKSK